MNEKQIRSLLKQQRENCLKVYKNYYAGSDEDFAPQCVCDDIMNAEEPVFVLGDDVDLIYELKKYFEETPREKILEDWENTKEWDSVGITVEEFIQNTNENNKNNDEDK